MTAVMITAHHERNEAAALATAAAEWLRAAGHEAFMPLADADALGLDGAEVFGPERPAKDAGLVLSLGGDGTMLRTVEMLAGAEVPIIGVNVGLLGYLAEVEPNAMTVALERFFAGDYVAERRMMLQVSVERAGGTAEESWRALNEAVLEKHESGHTVRLLVSIDGAPFTSYAADGLIIATPTGSTAYSLSARGPVVSPAHRAMLLTPVSPHMLFDRCLVLDPDEEIRVDVMGHRQVDLALDGRRVAALLEGDVIRCVPADSAAVFVRFGRRRFHQILKAKFGLSDR